MSESVLVVTLPGVQPRRMRLPVAGMPTNPVISPDGSRIAMDIRHKKEVWVATLDADGGDFLVLDGGWAPQWFGNDSLLYHNSLGFGMASADGNGRRQLLYPRTAHHPRWLSDSVIEFRVGRGGARPEPLHIAASSYRHWCDYNEDVFYLVKDTHRYCHDKLWQVNIRTGRFTRLTDKRPKPIVRVKSVEMQSKPVVSPDGRRTVFFNDGGDVEVRERGKAEGRLLLERRW